MNHAIILCGGEQTRWKSSSPKQLVEIHGEPLIERTARQLKLLHIAMPFVTVNSGGYKYFHRFRTTGSKRTICHTLLSCSCLIPNTRIIVLCGDVVWSDNAIKQVCEDRKELNMYGSFPASEIFGFSFSPAALDRVVNCLEMAVRGGGRLWNFYRALIGAPLDKHMFDANLWCEINDGFTTDFDFKEQYERWTQSHSL